MPKVKVKINVFLDFSHKKRDKKKNAREIQEERRLFSWEII